MSALARPQRRWPATAWKGIGSLTLLEAGVTVDGDGVVRVPYRRADGSLHREKLFPRGGGSFWGPGEGLLALGLELLPQPEKRTRSELMVCEGESDTLAVRDFLAMDGDERVYAIGLPGASTWRPDWRVHLEGFARVYVCGDGDEAGRKMAARILADVPWVRPVWPPPGEDVRSILQSGGLEAFGRLIDKADEAARMYAAFQAARTPAEWVEFMRGQIDG